MACARVDALRSHGFTKEALRLTVAVVRTMKAAALADKNMWTHEDGISG